MLPVNQKINVVSGGLKVVNVVQEDLYLFVSCLDEEVFRSGGRAAHLKPLLRLVVCFEESSQGKRLEQVIYRIQLKTDDRVLGISRRKNDQRLFVEASEKLNT